MAFPNCKYSLEQEHVTAIPETGFLESQAALIEQMSVQSSASHGPADMGYLRGSVEDNSVARLQQPAVEMPQPLQHTVHRSKYETKLLPGPQPEQLLHYQSPAEHAYCPIPALQHQYHAIAGYSGGVPPTAPYPYQRIAPHVNQDPHHLLYPKPIYSYSILIFMALKNSKTGSLPVSEIYNFMAEHFPYFKTAPDGWKNSVRHNLSLNKCFEKVENKFGGNSRKGCLWALNPSKVQKMQEELQKWRRKDPAAVRKSMARPDQLDRLIGEKPVKTKSPVLMPPAAHLEAPLCARDMSHSQCLGHLQPQSLLSRLPLHPVSEVRARVHTGLDINTKTLPQLHQPQQSRGQAEDVPDPSQAGHSPPLHGTPAFSCQLHPQLPVAKDGWEILMEADTGTDIDALNPSLLDLELQGNLWEVLKDDSLTLDPLVSVVMSPESPSLGACCWTEVAGVSQPWSSEGSPGHLQELEMCASCPGSGTQPCSHVVPTSSSPIALR